MRWHSKNLCDPQDPDFDESYNEEEDYDAYEEACIEREEIKREEQV